MKYLSMKTLLIVLPMVALLAAGCDSASQSTSSTDLNIKVSSSNIKGLIITNLENTDWQNCMVGINGSEGWGFDNPPYQTRATPLAIPAGKTITVPYTDITTQDGTRFNYSTHALNTVLVDCFRGSVSGQRYWIGGFK
jgi:hypothetical protein